MTLHHIVTILLLGFSFYAGFFRIGAVIILVHDVADIFLEVILHIERGFSDYWINPSPLEAYKVQPSLFLE